MGIILIFIPLVLFIIIEGIILYILINMVMNALEASDYAANAMIDHAYPIPVAMLYIFLLMTAIGVAIFLYIRFTIMPYVKEHNRKKAEAAAGDVSSDPSSSPSSFPSSLTAGNVAVNNSAAINLTDVSGAGGNGLKVFGISGRGPRRKSKKLLIIVLIAAFALIAGAAAYLFIFQPDWLPFDLPFTGGGNNNTIMPRQPANIPDDEWEDWNDDETLYFSGYLNII
ncbi:MAG: hypothetical protein FWH10_02630 [Oscillospiraceae bacterium]|nr:hypothetical protein [Oscillospiraceae bacterium]